MVIKAKQVATVMDTPTIEAIPTQRLPANIPNPSPQIFTTAVAPKDQVSQAATEAPASENSKLKLAMQIIAEESAVNISEFTDDVFFADIGIDSLLSLVIGSRFREELSWDVQVESFFVDFPTVKSLKEHLLEDAFSKENADDSGSQPIIPEVLIPEQVIPRAQPAAERFPVLTTEEILSGHTAILQAADLKSSRAVSADFLSALQIISEESGIAIADLTDDTAFADIGVDSLLTLVIGSRIREELSLDLQVETLFIDFPTVKEFKKSLAGHAYDETHEKHMSSSSSSTGSLSFDKINSDHDLATPFSEQSNKDSLLSEDSEWAPIPQATSVVIQGFLKTAKKILFLFPDGCGSATSYAGLPKLSSEIAVIGLNSPYVKNGQDMKCNFDQLVMSFLAEVRHRQPAGPYQLGGWSAGGILAYRATQELISAGEKVSSLILIDAPPPTGLDELPEHFYDFCDGIGLFGMSGQSPGNGRVSGSKAPEWLIPHFRAMNRVLHAYHASPLPMGRAPKTSIIWAGKSVLDAPNMPKLASRPDDPEDLKFLTVSRTDFSAAEWAEFFPGVETNVETMTEANHFSMFVRIPLVFTQSVNE